MCKSSKRTNSNGFFFLRSLQFSYLHRQFSRENDDDGNDSSRREENGLFYISNDRVMTQDHHSMKKVVVEEIYLEQDHFLSKQI